uniref:Microspherule protein N-terminal domain-containing protein n=1 Tax=Trypanosoma congolense (strain IL3000) TaxID=1068625 RepID=G0UY48_TRYCI|nr:conserved hypothetical protein [Trypanosoma congolense IL3000]
MQNPSRFSPDTSGTNFSRVHEIVQKHAKQGNKFSVAAALTLPSIHEDPEFWRTCKYKEGIVSLFLDSEENAQNNTNDTQRPELVRSDGDLYTLLCNTVRENAQLRDIIKRLESGECSREQGGTEPSPADSLRTAIEEARALLQSQATSQDSEGRRSAGEKRSRDDPGTQVHSPVRSEEYSSANEDHSPREMVPVSPDTVSEGKKFNAVDVLESIRALPGTRRTVSSFDALGDLLGNKEHVSAWVGAMANQRRASRNSESSIESAHDDFGSRGSMGSPCKKQRRFKFSQAEDEAILHGVARFRTGAQRFQQIFYAYRNVWHPARTVQQLYDHWRGTLRYKVIQQEGYRGKNSLAARVPRNSE